MPKFLSTGFLGLKGQRKGYSINTETILDGKRKTIQDSVKEDFIVCPDCEAYFSILEDLSNSIFLKWDDKVATNECTLRFIEEFLTILRCKSPSPQVLNLFVHSMFWRASISDYDLFENIKLTPAFEEELRQILLRYKSTARTAFLIKLLSLQSVPAYPSAVLTASSFTDETAIFLYASHTKIPFGLLIDKYLFWLFESEDSAKENALNSFFNDQSDEFRIMILSEQGCL